MATHTDLKKLEIQKIWKIMSGPGHSRRTDFILNWIQKNYFISHRHIYVVLGTDLSEFEAEFNHDTASEAYKSVVNNTYTV